MFWEEVDRVGETFIREMTLKLIEFRRRSRILLDEEGRKAALGRKTNGLRQRGFRVHAEGSSVWRRVGGKQADDGGEWQEMLMEGLIGLRFCII